jgi:Uma2 family endonuclease
MATSVVVLEEQEEHVEIPYFDSLTRFRAWALSDELPGRVRIDYIRGKVEVDMSPEDFFFHGSVKVEIAAELRNILRVAASGYLAVDRTRVSCPAADLSVEPDIIYIAAEALESGRVRLVPKTTGEDDRYVEVEGPPDMIVEIVNDSSVGKDTRRLPISYWEAGVQEYWLVDARGKELLFQIHERGKAGFEPVPADAEGFRRSRVFGRRFRLDRQRDRYDRWVFNCESRLEKSVGT